MESNETSFKMKFNELNISLDVPVTIFVAHLQMIQAMDGGKEAFVIMKQFVWIAYKYKIVLHYTLK